VTANSLIGQDHMAATSAGFLAQAGDKAYASLQAPRATCRRDAATASVITFSEPSTSSGGLAVDYPSRAVSAQTKPMAASAQSGH